jgi:hypothetical protein
VATPHIDEQRRKLDQLRSELRFARVYIYIYIYIYMCVCVCVSTCKCMVESTLLSLGVQMLYFDLATHQISRRDEPSPASTPANARMLRPSAESTGWRSNAHADSSERAVRLSCDG